MENNNNKEDLFPLGLDIRGVDKVEMNKHIKKCLSSFWTFQTANLIFAMCAGIIAGVILMILCPEAKLVEENIFVFFIFCAVMVFFALSWSLHYIIKDIGRRWFVSLHRAKEEQRAKEEKMSEKKIYDLIQPAHYLDKGLLGHYFDVIGVIEKNNYILCLLYPGVHSEYTMYVYGKFGKDEKIFVYDMIGLTTNGCRKFVYDDNDCLYESVRELTLLPEKDPAIADAD